MKLNRAGGAIAALGVSAALVLAGEAGKATDWAMNATVIEACSCPMFCQCYFNAEPAGHHQHGGGGATHFCKANNAYKVNKGNYGAVKLDGAKFWISTDLGANFADGEMDWAVLTFDRSLSKEQRDGIAAILPSVFPVKWKSFTTSEGDIDTWKFDKETAVATLDGGKTAEVRLRRPAASANTGDPVVVHNLKYWGAPRNDGFVLMPNEVEAYRVGPNAFEFKGTNGFMLTLDITSKDVAPAAAGGMK